ncbi:hypothetical protein EV191_101932 [Tamaricihabitans halophyticus]|uniref:Uncharacterized protein n=1 Tax=Tamaricihabitans halophyticus TaxID=1262583 RepID=A0A4R2R2L1_9PSEU|nr:hypothetical protein [Tamaricihabitans halophyticus]TCP56982.1 hypothetical protein EV191_101932 [Tamaricihabitans halophyticus]
MSANRRTALAGIAAGLRAADRRLTEVLRAGRDDALVAETLRWLGSAWEHLRQARRSVSNQDCLRVITSKARVDALLQQLADNPGIATVTRLHRRATPTGRVLAAAA